MHISKWKRNIIHKKDTVPLHLKACIAPKPFAGKYLLNYIYICVYH